MGVIDTPTKEASTEVKANDSQESPVSIGMTSEEVDLIPLKHFFDIEATDTRWDDKLSSIADWAKSKGVRSREDMLMELKKVELKLGRLSLTEHRIPKVYRYIALDRQLGGILKEMSAYEK